MRLVGRGQLEARAPWRASPVACSLASASLKASTAAACSPFMRLEHADHREAVDLPCVAEAALARHGELADRVVDQAHLLVGDAQVVVRVDVLGLDDLLQALLELGEDLLDRVLEVVLGAARRRQLLAAQLAEVVGQLRRQVERVALRGRSPPAARRGTGGCSGSSAARGATFRPRAPPAAPSAPRRADGRGGRSSRLEDLARLLDEALVEEEARLVALLGTGPLSSGAAFGTGRDACGAGGTSTEVVGARVKAPLLTAAGKTGGAVRATVPLAPVGTARGAEAGRRRGQLGAGAGAGRLVPACVQAGSSERGAASCGGGGAARGGERAAAPVRPPAREGAEERAAAPVRPPAWEGGRRRGTRRRSGRRAPG